MSFTALTEFPILNKFASVGIEGIAMESEMLGRRKWGRTGGSKNYGAGSGGNMAQIFCQAKWGGDADSVWVGNPRRRQQEEQNRRNIYTGVVVLVGVHCAGVVQRLGVGRERLAWQQRLSTIPVVLPKVSTSRLEGRGASKLDFAGDRGAGRGL